jgi:hypothetical protein
MEAMRGFRDMGVTDPGEVTRLTMASEMRGRMSGRTGQEMVAIGQTGAEMFRGTGINMEKGFELNQMNVGTVRSLLNQGLISRETIGQAGGENSLAQQMTAGALAAFQTSHGRASMMAAFNPATGGLNPNFISNMAGQGLMGQIAGAAGMGPAALLKFQAHQEEIISGMGPEQMQMTGIAMGAGGARELMRMAPGLGFEDSFRVWQQRQGMSKPMIDTQLAMLHQDPEQMKANQQQAVSTMRTQAGLEDMRNRFNIGKKISNVVRTSGISQTSNWIMKVDSELGSFVDDMALGLSGQAVLDPGMGSAKAGAAAEEYLKTHSVSSDAYDTRGKGLFGLGQSGDDLGVQIMARGEYSEQPPEQRIAGGATGTYKYRGGLAFEFASAGDAKAAAAARGQPYQIVSSAGGGSVIAVPADQLKKMHEDQMAHQFTQSEKDEADKKGTSASVGRSLIALGDNATPAELYSLIGGKADTYGDLTKLGDKAYLEKYGRSKGSMSAAATVAADKYGNTTLRQEVHKISGGGELTDTEAAGMKKAQAKGIESKNEILSLISSKGGDSIGIANTLRDHPDALVGLFNDKADDVSREFDLTNSLGNRSDIAPFLKIVKSMDSATKARISGLFGDVVGGMSATKKLAGGKGGTDVGKGFGDISKETTKILEAQSTQLLANYTQLIALQKQLNDLMGSKK